MVESLISSGIEDHIFGPINGMYSTIRSRLLNALKKVSCSISAYLGTSESAYTNECSNRHLRGKAVRYSSIYSQCIPGDTFFPDCTTPLLLCKL